MFDIVVSHGPVDVESDLSLAQLSDLASHAGQHGKHAPVGFYVGDFGYSVRADVSGSDEAHCSRAVQVMITLGLANRHVQVAKEWAADPCRYEVAQAHYLRHAAADDIVVSQFARTLETTLRQAPLPSLTGSPSAADEDRHRVEQAVTTMVESRLKALDHARADARDTVDTPDEVRKLSEACSSAT
jgi:hypothetical protein